ERERLMLRQEVTHSRLTVSIPEGMEKGCQLLYNYHFLYVCVCVCLLAGHRVYQKCGPRPKELCKPCKPGTFTLKDNSLKCERCTECAGAQVLLKECTATADTQCGCREGLKCGDSKCSFCVQKCNKGEQPTKNRSCEPCPEGTFNNQIHQRCKPQITECVILFSHAVINVHRNFRNFMKTKIIHCNSSVIGFISTKVSQKSRPHQGEHEPMTLRAVECSFHEAQQEQGSSSESLDSKDSSGHLLA
uniref:Tumor necrosis factor receptor superfamily, member 9a n=1 Tax=Echeneis naucrates TaxID=173247 RepID=A0A665VKT2_ECHNA